MDSSEYSTIKVPKSLKRRLHAFKAGLMAKWKTHVSDAEAIAQAMFDSKKAASRFELNQNTPSVWDMAGSIKGGKKFNAVKEIDKVVYGV